MRPVLRYSLLLFFISLSVMVSAQVKLYTTIHPETIHKDELATFRIIIEGSKDLQHISPPDFKDFIVISGPNEQSGNVLINGATAHYLSLSFILQPRHAGTLKIGKTEIREKGKLLKSNTLKLVVKNSTSANSNSFSSFNWLHPSIINRPFTLSRTMNFLVALAVIIA